MKTTKSFLALGEAMVEMAPTREFLYKRGFAGDTLNTAWYLRAYLADSWKVGYVTALGDDPLSFEMSDFIQRNGIDTTYVKHIPGKSPGLYLISLKDGERRFSYWRENSAARQLVKNAALLEEAISGADNLFLSGISIAILPKEDREVLLSMLKDYSLHGGEISFDPNVRLTLWEDIDSCRYWTSQFAAISTNVLPSFDDEQLLFADESPEMTCRRYQKLGANVIVVKNGSNPVTFCVNEFIDLIPVADVVRLVDSTGAGDSFNGAYLASVASGYSQKEAINRAISLSAKVVGQQGALIAMSELLSASRTGTSS